MIMKRKHFFYLIAISSVFIMIFFLYRPYKPLDKSVRIDKIIVDKSDRKLSIYENGKLIKSYKISLGKVSKGAKEFEGDMKTPEGLYVINDKNSKSGYHKNLGCIAVTDKEIDELYEIIPIGTQIEIKP